MGYQCEATSLAGFVQQLAVSYVRNGYWFYVTGRIPSHKDPQAVDAKLIDRYDIGLSKWAKSRRFREGRAKVQYIRYGRFFVLLATRGVHRFFNAVDDPLLPGESCRDASDVETRIRDARARPIRFSAYAISYAPDAKTVCVRIQQEHFKQLKERFVALALKRNAVDLETMLGGLRYIPYAPVYQQLRQIGNAINRTRKAAGHEPIALSCIRRKRPIVKPFGLPQRSECRNTEPTENNIPACDDTTCNCPAQRRPEHGRTDAEQDGAGMVTSVSFQRGA